MTDVFYEKSEIYPGQSVRVADGDNDGVWIGVHTNGARPSFGAHLPNAQAVRLATAILKAAGVDSVDQAPKTQPERVKYVNNTGGAANNYVGQFADVLSRNDECQMTYLKFADNAAFWVDNDNVQPPPPFPGGTTSTRMFVAGYSFEAAVEKVFTEAQALLLKKHKDYGPTNISASPGGPLNGLRVRIHDKVARINHLIDSGATPENESLRDSFTDLLNYAAIAQLVIDGKWPAE